MKDYPLSDYADDAKKKLKELEMPVPEADPVAVRPHEVGAGESHQAGHALEAHRIPAARARI